MISNARFYEGQDGAACGCMRMPSSPATPGRATKASEIHVALRRGATVKFRLIGPDGQPARDVWVYSRAVLGPTAASAVRGWLGPLP